MGQLNRAQSLYLPQKQYFNSMHYLSYIKRHQVIIWIWAHLSILTNIRILLKWFKMCLFLSYWWCKMVHVRASHCWSEIFTILSSSVCYWGPVISANFDVFFYIWQKGHTHDYFWSEDDDLICKYDCLRGLLFEVKNFEQPQEF